MSNPDLREIVRKLYYLEPNEAAASVLTPQEDEWVTTYLNGGDFGPSLDGQLKSIELALQRIKTIHNDKTRTRTAVEIWERLKTLQRHMKNAPEEDVLRDRFVEAAVTLKRDGFRLS